MQESKRTLKILQKRRKGFLLVAKGHYSQEMTVNFRHAVFRDQCRNRFLHEMSLNNRQP